MDTSAFWFVVVATMWGGTNPLLKRGSKGVERIREHNRIQQFLSELKFLFFNWKYLVPFCINQGGSVIYYLTLATADLSLAVPITNSLTFIFTSISGTLMGEKPPSRDTCFGMMLVVCGVALCVLDKV
ncbi:transmembrane protein 234-like [Ylistrum balloti]|uniref:transmembrane protein 234-like n=1 Tax=Ylistrum balloti TaxID=509963 RepID=UPI0029059332|nr:transmembrane protein 234-like [Ylistrum balloti]